MFDFKECGTLTFPGHDNLIQLSAGLIKLPSEVSYKRILLV
jgi:hypothetical protein